MKAQFQSRSVSHQPLSDQKYTAVYENQSIKDFLQEKLQRHNHTKTQPAGSNIHTVSLMNAHSPTNAQGHTKSQQSFLPLSTLDSKAIAGMNQQTLTPPVKSVSQKLRSDASDKLLNTSAYAGELPHSRSSTKDLISKDEKIELLIRENKSVCDLLVK